MRDEKDLNSSLILYPSSLNHNVISQSEHFKKFDGFLLYVGKNDFRARRLCRVNHAEQNRNADAVDDFSFGKIDDELFRARIEFAFAFAFDNFAAQFVQVIARENGRRFA